MEQKLSTQKSKTLKSKKDYVNPEKLYYAVLEAQKLKTFTKECHDYFDKMIRKILSMNQYPLQEDYDDCYITALSYCWTGICGTSAFDPKLSSNAFSFFTQIIKNATTLAWNRLYPKKYKNTIGFIGSSETGSGIYSM